MPSATSSRTAQPPSARTLVASVVATLALGACSAKPVVDDTPLVRTAIVTSDISNNGFKGFFANEGEHVVSTVEDMQRVDDRFRFTGSVMGRFGGKQDRSEIVRLDRDLEWQLDNRREEYFECALGGCSTLATFDENVFADDDEEFDLEEDPENACVMRTVENVFDVTRTGERRDINGFPAEEYVVDWRHTMKDGEGKLSRNRLAMTVWTTPETGDVGEAVRMQAAFDERYRAALDDGYPAQFDTAIPPAAAEVLAKYLLAGLSEADLAELKRRMGRATVIEGFPVSRKIQWDARNEACNAPPEEVANEDDSFDTSSVGGLLSSIGKGLVKQEIRKKEEEKRREIDMAPVFSLVEEVRSIEIGDIRESRLSVPADYSLQTRR